MPQQEDPEVTRAGESSPVGRDIRGDDTAHASQVRSAARRKLFGDEPRAAKERREAKETLPATEHAQGQPGPSSRRTVRVESLEASAEEFEREPILPSGAMLANFSIMRLLGRGGMGEVYLARDVQLGRKVALKLIHPEFLTAPGARERFFHEARTTAKFNHPHIVGIHGVGEVDGRPYVALEYLEGENLRERLLTENMGEQAALRVARAIAEALVEAHRHGVLHRDLKPENVMLCRDGRLRVVDFGLAKDLNVQPGDGAPASSRDALVPSSRLAQGVEATGRMGTPHYMAPEQWTGKTCSGATDVWALGVILYELVTGSLPYEEFDLVSQALAVCSPKPVPDPAGRGAPAAIAGLIRACLLKDPTDRPRASEVVAKLRSLVGAAHDVPIDESPFRGLLPFTERHATFFVGRDAELARFLERLRVTPILPVVGPSASGKTSFIRAGVIPRLTQDDEWRVLHLRPGKNPIHALAARVVLRDSEASSERIISASEQDEHAADERISQLEEAFRAKPQQLSVELRALVHEWGAKVLLYVDQLEDVFTLVDDDTERSCFLEAVLGAADDVLDPIRVVFSMRHDFLDRLAAWPIGRMALQHVTVLQPPDERVLRDVISLPIEALGYRYDDPELVGEMVAAVGEVSNGLALLQFTGERMWAERDQKNRLLLRSTYEAIGGVSGALATHADGVVQGLALGERDIARELLVRLVAHGKTRRLTRQALLDGVHGSDAERVLQRLTEERLVAVIRGSAAGTAEAELELAHESLLESWSTLSHWIEQGHEDSLFVSEAEQAAELWQRRGERREELWHGEALSEALAKLERCQSPIPAGAARFLEQSRREHDRLRRRQRVIAGVVIGLSVVVAMAATVVALVFGEKEKEASMARDTSERLRERAESLRAESLREGAQSAMRQGDMLEARAKLRLAFTVADEPLARALWWQLAERPLVWTARHSGSVYGVAFSPNGQYVASASLDRTIHLTDTRTRAVRILRGHEDQVFCVAYSADQKWLASGSWNGVIRIWHAAHGRQERVLRGHSDAVRSVAFSRDSKWLASASWDGTVRLWDMALGTATHVLSGHTARVYSVAFSPDGKWLASGGRDRSIKIWNTATGGLHANLSGHEDAIVGVRFHPDGKRIVSASSDRTIKIWPSDGGKALRSIDSQGRKPTALDISRDGQLLVTANADGSLRVWDIARGTLRAHIPGHEKRTVYSVAISHNGEQLTSGGADERVRLWNVPPARRLASRSPHAGSVNAVKFSRDGQYVVTAGADRDVRLWDVKTGTQREALRGHNKKVLAVAVSPDGTRLATAGLGRTVRLWALPSGRALRTLATPPDSTWSLSFSADGSLLASSHWSGRVRVWDLRNDTHRDLLGHTGTAWTAAFAPSGSLLATASSDRTLRIWDARSGAQRYLFDSHDAPLHGVSFSPNGRSLVASSHDKSVRMWTLGEANHRIIGHHDGRAYATTHHPHDPIVGTTSADGTARLWRTDTKQHQVLAGHRSEVNAIDFGPNGKLVATAGDDGSVRLWDVASGQPRWTTVLMLAAPARIFSHRGWTRLVDGKSSADWAWGKHARRALETRAVLASVWPGDAPLLCLEARDNTIELWDLEADRRLSRTATAHVNGLLAVSSGCLVRVGDRKTGSIQRHLRDGKADEVVHGPGLAVMTKDVATDGRLAGVLVIQDRKLLRLDASGGIVSQHAIGLGASAVVQRGEYAIVGYSDGDIAQVKLTTPSAGATSLAAHHAFEPMPSEAGAASVVSIALGPEGTVIAGFSNGGVGLWNKTTGTLLRHAYLHGAVDRLLVDAQKLYAVTDLGQHATWDLSVFYRPYCELLRRVWREVPVIWQDGQPAVATTPATHRCAPRAKKQAP
jgi:WD40 repeat protein/serine/threonine protein kinase